MIKSCLPCQPSSPENSSRRESLNMTTLPKAHWDEVCADVIGTLPSGNYLLIVYDEYSRYPEVERVTSTSSNAVIPVFDNIFTPHGIPSIIKTDNGPPFNSDQFRMSRHTGQGQLVILNVLSRHWIKTLHTGEAEQLPWKQELYKFLRNYRATPHTSTDKPPAELLFNRPFRTVLLELTQPVNYVTVRVKDEHSKLRIKQHADAYAYAKAKPHKINIGDTVLIRQKPTGKLWTPFSPVVYPVIQVKGSMITAK